jgi:hypothetical protein
MPGIGEGQELTFAASIKRGMDGSKVISENRASFPVEIFPTDRAFPREALRARLRAV